MKKSGPHSHVSCTWRNRFGFCSRKKESLRTMVNFPSISLRPSLVLASEFSVEFCANLAISLAPRNIPTRKQGRKKAISCALPQSRTDKSAPIVAAKPIVTGISITTTTLSNRDPTSSKFCAWVGRVRVWVHGYLHVWSGRARKGLVRRLRRPDPFHRKHNLESTPLLFCLVHSFMLQRK